MKGRRIRGAQRYYPTRSRNFRCRPPYRPVASSGFSGICISSRRSRKQTHFHQSALTVRKIGGRRTRGPTSPIRDLGTGFQRIAQLLCDGLMRDMPRGAQVENLSFFLTAGKMQQNFPQASKPITIWTPFDSAHTI